jgi:hypothetical protein
MRCGALRCDIVALHVYDRGKCWKRQMIFDVLPLRFRYLLPFVMMRSDASSPLFMSLTARYATI